MHPAAHPSLGDDVSLVDFAQKLIDDGLVTDMEKLEKLAGMAQVRAPKEPAPGRTRSTSPRRAPPPPSWEDRREIGPSALAVVSVRHGRRPRGRRALADAMRELLRSTGALRWPSDLHLSTGARPFIRKNRALSFLSEHVLTPEESMRMNTVLLSPPQKKAFLEHRDFDYALALNASERYPGQPDGSQAGRGGSLPPGARQRCRRWPTWASAAHIDTIKQKMLSYHNGLVLVTGPVGSGKTTTLASMVAYLENETREDHIITVE